MPAVPCSKMSGASALFILLLYTSTYCDAIIATSFAAVDLEKAVLVDETVAKIIVFRVSVTASFRLCRKWLPPVLTANCFDSQFSCWMEHIDDQMVLLLS